ncbi:MAG: 3-isopropylmalate dehydrogenase [Gammaproteobacteria bacterium]
MKAVIAVLAGDGIGPEIIAEAVKVLRAVERKFGHEFEMPEALFGAVAIDATGSPLPPETLALAERADAILFGAVGDPRFADPNLKVRPEQGILGLRKALGLYANLRPVAIHEVLLDVSPLKPEYLRGVDIMVVRELTGGIYFGEKTRTAESASDLCTYSVPEIERVVRAAANLARGRRRKLTSVDKANVMETSRLWRAVTTRVMAEEYPDIALDHMYIDAAAMHLLRRPADFDVIVTENLFGDVLTDEAAMLPGSLGMLPSASLGTGSRGIYEPIHGSAPDIAGRGIANPYATILSAALLLRLSLGLEAEARAVEAAVAAAVAGGMRTADLRPVGRAATTAEAGAAVLAHLG